MMIDSNVETECSRRAFEYAENLKELRDELFALLNLDNDVLGAAQGGLANSIIAYRDAHKEHLRRVKELQAKATELIRNSGDDKPNIEIGFDRNGDGYSVALLTGSDPIHVSATVDWEVEIRHQFEVWIGMVKEGRKKGTQGGSKLRFFRPASV